MSGAELTLDHYIINGDFNNAAELITEYVMTQVCGVWLGIMFIDFRVGFELIWCWFMCCIYVSYLYLLHSFDL